ncbi:MAG: hypothetical protein IH622_13520 [Ochrobactrum anthropi]|uniref:Uncharacterized protein n=1 Tax=Brucella anthropi TaxID=529 RepID=A0A8I0N4X4_BRUAN|nr:hypothetical protein [Brucella anthropi]MBE0561816.1 hypothetical protein [Brucella anthropi]
MSFELRITGNDAAELAQDALAFAFLVSPNLKEKLFAATAPSPEQPAVDEQKAEQPKPTRRSKKAEPVDEKPVEQPAPEPEETIVEEVEDTVEEAELSAADDVAESEIEDNTDDEPCMSVDDLRKYTIANYLNACFDDMALRSTKFRELLAEVNLVKLADIEPGQINKFKAIVDQKIAEIGAGVK